MAQQIKTTGPRKLSYRYIPGAVGDGTPWDNGALMTQEFRLSKSRDKRLAELKADPRIQWAEAND